MTDNSTQVFNENLPTQESDYTAYEKLEEMSSALVIASDCSSKRCDDDQLLNESVTVRVFFRESFEISNNTFGCF